MTTEFVDLKEEMTVSEAFDKIRRTGIEKETIYSCHVVRHDRLLVGVVSAKRIMLSNPLVKIGDIMDTNIIFAQTTDDKEVITELFKRYALLSLPIVDKEQRLVGIVTVDDIVQIIEEESTEDFERMAALTPSEERYMKTNILKLSRNRIPWLMVLMLTAITTEMIFKGFEDALEVLPILAAFTPMLMDTSGNAGMQVAALVIRGIALGEILAKNLLKILWREVRVGVICGGTLGLVNFFRVYFMNERNAMISLTVTIGVIFTVVMAKTIGCILPIGAKMLRLDPTVCAMPMITTVADAASLIFFFSLAKVLLGI
jgi:magnesium transporter